MAKPFFKSLFKRKVRGSSHKGSKDDLSQFIPSLYDPDEPHEGGFRPVQSSYEEKMCALASQWSLVDRMGKRLKLPHTMLFLGREDCDVNLVSRSVDKRHAVLTFDGYEDKFRVKDLGSVNGTYVNDSRIPEQEYVTLEDMDTVRFGYDPMVYQMERIEEMPHLEHLEQQQHRHQHQAHTEVKVSPAEVSPRSSPVQTELPSWAVREPPPPQESHRMGLAECQGCIFEQGIQHTCGFSEDTEYLSTDGSFRGSTNGHTCLPLSPPHPVSYSRWEGPPNQHHSHHSQQREQLYYVSSSTRGHSHQTSRGVSSGQYVSEARPYSHHNFVPQTQPESQPPSSCHNPQVVYQSPVHSQNNNVIYPGQNLTQTNSYDGQGRQRPTELSISQPAPPHHQQQQQQKYQTNFQIIPPRQGQNYRVINVKFAGADLNQPKAKLDVLSPSSSGYQHINASVGHFIFTTPMDGTPESQSQSNINANQVTHDQEYVNANYLRSPSKEQSPIHTGYIGVGLGGRNGMVQTSEKTSPPYTRRQSSSNLDSSPVHTGIYSPTSPKTPTIPGSPVAMRQDKRRSLIGTEPELETIKKCTPLYGQPSWWGEEDAEDYGYPHTATLKDADRSPDAAKNNDVERPKSLSLEETDGADMNKYKSDPQYSTTYMEIPQKDTSPEKDGDGKSLTPEKTSSKHTLAKEDSNKEQDLHSPLDEDESPPKTPSEKSAVPMAFTVDLGDDMFGAPKISMNDSLSQFLPHKVRKSFRSRSVKNPKDSGKEDSPASGKTSRDGSPTRLAKAEDTWHSGSPQYHSDGHHSALSSDNEDLSIRSDTVTTKTKQSSHSSRGTASIRAFRREMQQSATSKTTMTKIELNKQASMTATNQDPASYLIDKMFTQQTGRSGSQGETAANQEPEESPQHVPFDETLVYNTPSDGSPSKHSHSGSGSKAKPHVKTKKSTQDSKRNQSKEKTGEEGPGDNVSESGTYTIESENTGKEVQEARKSIDAVFGVMPESDTEIVKTKKPAVDRKGLSENKVRSDLQKFDSGRHRLLIGDSMEVEVGSGVHEEEKEDYKIVEVLFDGVWASPKLTRRTPEVHSYQPEAVLAQATEETPKWVSQWATLATHKTFVKSPTLSTNSPIHYGLSENCDVKSSSDSTHEVHTSDYGPSLPARRTRGTGRKLPTPPVKSGSTTPISPKSTTGPSSDVFSPRDSILSETPERDVNSPEPLSPAPLTSHAFINPRPETSGVTENMNCDVTSDVVTFVHGEMTASMDSSQMADSFHESMEDEIEELITNYQRRPLESNRSNISLDTEVLLRDTADVVQAMAERVNNNHKHQEHQQKVDEEERTASTKSSTVQDDIWRRKSTELFIPLHDEDSDSEGSTFAIVNGHREMPKFKPKPKLLKSQSVDSRKPPRPLLHLREREKEREPVRERASVPRETRNVINSSMRAKSAPKEKPTPKVPKDATFVKKVGGSTRNGHYGVPPLDLNNSFGSDIHSESETGSILSTSTDYSESLSPKMARKGSKGKGPMTMTRPNRAFALRRARLESEPEPHSVTSRSQATTPRSRPTSAGARDTSKSRPLSARDSSRSERTDVSLGAKIVQRSRESSSSAPRAKSAGPLSRTDTGRGSGRGSIRDKKPAPPSTSRKSPAPPSTSRKSPAPPSSSRSKSERISVNNLSVSGTKSKPSSRSNSPRSEEYSAWKRRKSYDPRQAVVNAKQKVKDLRSKNTPERSLSAGPLHSRGDTFSSVSSEDTSFIEEYHGYQERGQSDSISHISSVVTHEMEAMSRSIECDDAFSGAETKLATSLHNLLVSRSNRSAFSVPRTKSLPLTLRSPPPLQLRNRFTACLNGNDESKAGVTQKDTKTQESYDTVMVNSIYQLSLKVKTQTDKIMEKMRDRYEMNGSPSPTDDLPSPSLDTEIPGYKNANQELAGILRNLRKTERHLQVIDRTLSPGMDGGASPGSPKDHQQYLRELERIRSEISGFKPIDKPVLSSSKPWRRLSKQPSQESDATDPLASDEYY